MRHNFTKKALKIYRSPVDFGIFLIFFATRVAPHACGEPHIPKQSLVEFQVALVYPR